MNVTIRKATPKDYHPTEELTREAFWDLFRPGCDEHLILHQLRHSPDYVPELDYLAEAEGQVVGHILYTRARVEGGGTEQKLLGLGPLCVLPAHQKHGIGRALIQRTLEEAKRLGYRGVALYGHPTYYPRFGFQSAEAFDITTPDGKNFDAFMVLPLYDGALSGLRGRLYMSDAFVHSPEALEAFERQFPPKEKRFQGE